MELLNINNYRVHHAKDILYYRGLFEGSFLGARIYVRYTSDMSAYRELTWDLIEIIHFLNRANILVQVAKVSLTGLVQLLRCKKIFMRRCIGCDAGAIFIPTIMFCKGCHGQINGRYEGGLARFMLIGAILGDQDLIGLVRATLCAIL